MTGRTDKIRPPDPVVKGQSQLSSSSAASAANSSSNVLRQKSFLQSFLLTLPVPKHIQQVCRIGVSLM